MANNSSAMKTKPRQHERGFRILEFRNPAGSISFRVQGWRQGRRLRENFHSVQAAEARRLELENERLGLNTPETLRATWLTSDQLKAAEGVFLALPDPDEVARAVSWWQARGKREEGATRHAEDMRLDDAVTRFNAWLENSPALRDATRRNLRYRVAMFASEVGNIPLASITPESIEAWLDTRKAGPVTKSNDARALKRFFSWCCERRQRFLTTNPCAVVRIELPERAAPEIYTMREVLRILAAARRFRNGRFLKGIVLTLFAGLRPTEALRFRDDQLRDGVFRVESMQSKTKESRTIEADPVLLVWLKECDERPAVDPQNSKLLWAEFKAMARLKRWIPDGLRHTAISHYFRRTGSYGLTAEWAGNSEEVIKQNYQARTTVADTARYWRLFPSREARKQAVRWNMGEK